MYPFSPGGGIGRHKGLKIPRQQWRAGSSPAPGTTTFSISVIYINIQKLILYFLHMIKCLAKSTKLCRQISQLDSVVIISKIMDKLL